MVRIILGKVPLATRFSGDTHTLVELLIQIFFYTHIALFTPGGRPKALHIITPGHWALIHTLNHLNSLLGSIQPCATLICATRQNPSREPSLPS